jgi:hypothetical protein
MGIISYQVLSCILIGWVVAGAGGAADYVPETRWPRKPDEFKAAITAYYQVRRPSVSHTGNHSNVCSCFYCYASPWLLGSECVLFGV